MRPLLILGASLFVLLGCEGAIDGTSAEFALQTRNALEILPADADLAGMANLEAIRESALFENHESPFSPQNMDGESAARFNEFMRQTGFDPDQDLSRVYMSAKDGEDGQERPAFVVFANFDRARIDGYLDANASTELSRSTYNDTPIYTADEEDGTFGIGLVNDDMAVAGDLSEVRAMIDRIANGTQGLSSNAEMMALIERADHPDGAWFAVRRFDGRGASDSPRAGPMASMGEAANLMGSAVMSFGFDRGEVHMSVVGLPRDNANVGGVADMLRGAVAVMRTSSEQDNPELASMLDGLRVRESGDAIRVDAVLQPSLFNDRHVDRKH